MQRGSKGDRADIPLPLPGAGHPRHDQYYAPELRHPNRPRDGLFPVPSIQTTENGEMQVSGTKVPIEIGSQKLGGGGGRGGGWWLDGDGHRREKFRGSKVFNVAEEWRKIWWMDSFRSLFFLFLFLSFFFLILFLLSWSFEFFSGRSRRFLSDYDIF